MRMPPSTCWGAGGAAGSLAQPVNDATQAMAAWMSGAVDDPTRGWTAAEPAEHVRVEYSTFSWLFEPMLERCGFEILERGYVRRAYGAYTLRRR